MAHHTHVQILPPNYISLHVAYYHLMRKIALAYLHPEAQLQDGLHQTLRSYSEKDMDQIDKFCFFLFFGSADFCERDRHDINKPLSE
jgi:hypothetical protein